MEKIQKNDVLYLLHKKTLIVNLNKCAAVTYTNVKRRNMGSLTFGSPLNTLLSF